MKNIKKDHINTALLALIASSMIYLNTQFIKFSIENSKQHSAITKTLDTEISYTHSLNNYVIKPNTENIKKLDKKVEDHEKRINKLENKRK